MLVGPYGIWLCGADYLGGVIYQENGVYLRKKEVINSDGNKEYKTEYLEEVEARWLAEKEALENLISSLFPRMLEQLPLLIRGGACLAEHENGGNRTFPAAYGLDVELEDMNNALGRPHDINRIPIEPILTEEQVKAIAGALHERSSRVNIYLDEILVKTIFSDQELKELCYCHGDPEGMEKCVKRIFDKREQVKNHEGRSLRFFATRP